MTYTLAEVEEKTGISQANLRKKIERGQLAAEKDGNKLVVTESALQNLMGAAGLREVASMVEAGQTREVGNAIANLPPKIRDAILEGMGTTPKKAASPDAYRKAVAGAKRVKAPVDTGDPHWGFPVGHKHKVTPRWERVSEHEWKLGTAGYRWNGFLWEGTGSREGTVLEDATITPAHPDTHYRPLAPAPVAAK